MAPPPAAAASEPDSSSGTVQLLLRNIDSRTTVIRARQKDTLNSILYTLFGEGVTYLCVSYAGRNLPREATIGELGLPWDATLHVSSRLRSTVHAQAWSLASEIANAARRLVSLEDLVTRFLDLVLVFPGSARSLAAIADHVEIFFHSGAPVVLLQQYLSPEQEPRRAEAERAIRCLLSLDRIVQRFTAPVLLEICRCIVAAGEPKDDDLLYAEIRGVLATALSDPGWASARWLDASRKWVAEQVSRLAAEMARALMEEISGTNCCHPEVAAWNVTEFKIFWSVLLELELELDKDTSPHLPWRSTLSDTLASLLRSVDECMARFEKTSLPPRSPWREHAVSSSSSTPVWTVSPDSVWAILSTLDAWSQKDARWVLRRALRTTVAEHAAAVTALVLSAGRDLWLNSSWITRHRDLLPFEARRHLAMAVLPELVTGVHAPYEMLIDRSQLLSDSFGYVARATPQELCAAMSVAFKHEQAAGPGVLREWFSLVCQALFNTSLVLFSACPHDRRRFFINPSEFASSGPLTSTAICEDAISPLLIRVFKFIV